MKTLMQELRYSMYLNSIYRMKQKKDITSLLNTEAENLSIFTAMHLKTTTEKKVRGISDLFMSGEISLI